MSQAGRPRDSGAWRPPNLPLLNAALTQTGWQGPVMMIANWRTELHQRREALDWESARADVRPLLERARDIAPVSKETLGILLGAGP